MRNLLRFGAAALMAAGFAVALPSPAQAVVSADGYVWASQPDAVSYTATTGYERNSTGGTVQVSRSGTGVYQVRFTGMATSGGVAHARPYGSGNNRICTVASWGPSGADQVVNVRCFDAGGVPANSLFTAHFSNRTAAAGSFGYFWAHDATPAGGGYVPSGAYAYDSTGLTNHVTRQSTGVYMLQIGAVDAYFPVGHDDGVYQITAYGTAAVRCEVFGENDEDPTPIGVFCHNHNGVLVDSRFSVSYSHSVTVLGTATAAFGNIHSRHSWMSPVFYPAGWWNSAGGAPTITTLGTGRYRVAFPGLSIGSGYAVAGSRGDTSTYCTVAFWGSNSVTVNCYDQVTDAYADSDFTVAFTA
ncbi:hypothetical protein F4553_001471 [Allocatelliglobosispora scoriae]|uniref:Uncharacterized protein n=1 Tax=Allocatelliglobosispora scoriae TaxID=643052 RepID=A0A841BMW9_9ACTN|nr:hypothetical protein [Allocatelliglobosispora scoriae]MBB5868092.1 hypothetical protein [Allocatelliglobosispora scoriae]